MSPLLPTYSVIGCACRNMQKSAMPEQENNRRHYQTRRPFRNDDHLARDGARFANHGDLHLTRRLSVPVSSRLVLALSRADLSGRPASVHRVPTAKKVLPLTKGGFRRACRYGRMAYPDRRLFGVRDGAGFANHGDLHLTRRLSVPVSSRLVLALSRADLSGRPASVHRVPMEQKSPPFYKGRI